MQIKLYLSNEIDTIKQYFQETLQIIEAVIYKMVGAEASFRTKMVGMTRRAVRILQRCCRYLFPRLVLAIGTWIQDSLLGLPSFLLKKPDFTLQGRPLIK
jgi:hypothetical protein